MLRGTETRDLPKVRETVATRQPIRAARAARQRERILDAAEKCFIRSGFHAASMARIAATARVSAGLIYRYFDSKTAIVRAIVARHLETEGTARIDALNSTEQVASCMLDIFEHWRRGDDPNVNLALMLELTAAATRHADIAQVVRDKDRVVGQAIEQAVKRIGASRGVALSPAAMRGRTMMLQCLFEGLASRAVRDPTIKLTVLKPVLESMIAALLCSPNGNGA